MGSDYQMALLLQKQLEHESLVDSDRQVAVLMHQQFEDEMKSDESAKHLTYGSGGRRTKDSSKSLTDPSWEVIDPTPDIHMLFVAFSSRFFWDKLQTVSVSWSKRMTSCAGICSYRGGGLCQITLSEPLLKLRPRKDLVETLLHEMIHAYLFVTHNNKDRDGHGPEFHKHMYRINEEAGTKITVYHSFIDEVNLYRQHWWRCDGPCQKRRPYFGMVRRAMNRAPGPNDKWWAAHVATCGGKFIKVREPEKKDSKKDVPPKPKEDIRTYIPANNSNSKSTSSVIKGAPVRKTTTAGILASAKNNSIKNLQKNAGVVPGRSNNSVKPAAVQVISQYNANGSPKRGTETRVNRTNNSKIILVDTTPNRGDAFITAKNHWKDKYSPSSHQSQSNKNTHGVKRLHESNNADNKSSRIKIDTPVACPICGAEYSLEKLDVHIDTCKPENNDLKECIICLTKVADSLYEEHVTRCADKNFKDTFDEEDVRFVDDIQYNARKSDKTKHDPINDLQFTNKDSDSISNKHKNNIVDLVTDELDTKSCPVCDKCVATLDYNKHVETCLHEMYSDMENNYLENSNATTKCLACGKDIAKSSLNAHLEECIIDIFKEDLDSVASSGKRDEYICPFCLEMYSEMEMAAHFEKCIHCLQNTGQSDVEKSVLLKSLFDEDEF